MRGFFYGLSPAIRDGGVVAGCFFTGCRPQYGTEGVWRFFFTGCRPQYGTEGCEGVFFYGLSPAIRDGAVVRSGFLRAVACSRGWEGGVPVVVADVAGEVVEEEALGAGDAALVVVVGPWGDEEETALGTGVELAAAGLL